MLKQNNKKIAYVRVSTREQKCDRQIDALKEMADELHIETISAASRSRPVYEAVIKALRPHDTFVILDLDRAYRSARDALVELEKLRARHIQIHIANLNLDTGTPHGMLIYTVISGLAEFEREMLSRRTKEGLAAARRRGKRLGRPAKLSARDLRTAEARLQNNKESYAKVAADYGVSGWTLSRALSRQGAAIKR